MINQTEIYFILGFFIVLLILGAFLSILAKNKDDEENESLASRIERALPQVQCGQCGFPGCKGYAMALANNETTCNKCTPGGPELVTELASILGIDVPDGADSDEMLFVPRTVAFVHASACTGCTKCKRVCPVDAITGSARQAHVVDREECIGCTDCVKSCPVQCIEMIKLEPTLKNFNWELNSFRITGGASNHG